MMSPHEQALVMLMLVVLAGPMMPCSLSSLGTPQCRFAYTGLALLSCQETAAQAPTRSCCDALLFAIDISPNNILDKGVCCLCRYMVATATSFDLPGAYISCGGKDARAVQAWQATAASATDCDDPCGLEGPRSPPAPAGGSGTGGGNGKRRKQHAGGRLGVGAIIAIVVGSLFGAALLAWCLYSKVFGPAAKERTSPDPTNRSAQQGEADGGGLEMPRLSSARRSTSVLL